MSRSWFLTTIGEDAHEVPVVRGVFALCSTVACAADQAVQP